MVIENCAPLAVGVNGGDAADGSESPLALCAVTVQVYSTSLMRPPTVTEVVAPPTVAECVSSGLSVAVQVAV